MTLVTRDPAIGLRHPNGQPPTPFGCRWCPTIQALDNKEHTP